jgi:hypothetical protein
MSESEPVSLRDYVESRITDVKEHFEARINNLERHLKEMDEQKDQAKALALKELERRLHDLNNAHQRAADVLQTYLPREVWEKYREEDMSWKRQDEVLRSSWVTQDEFRTYKETTQQALTLTAGKGQGISSVWSVIVIVFSILAAVGTVGNALVAYVRIH